MKKNDLFDKEIRRRASGEEMTPTADADLFFQTAMSKARISCAQNSENAPKKQNRKAWAIVAAECVVALTLLLILPVRDVTRQSLFQRQSAYTAAMKPVTQGVVDKGPSVQIDMLYVGDTVMLEGRFENVEDDDLWLVKWEASLDQPAGQPPYEGLIWLESGAECTHQIKWENISSEHAQASWNYTAYRVTAGMLHWMDGEALQPGDEDYTDQQLLMQDAFEADALIIEVGDWPNGMAGPVRILLPDAYLSMNPEQTAVAYCIENGLLEDGSHLCSGQDSAVCTMLK